VEEPDLRDFFSKFGPIVSVWVARRPRGFGYVIFENEQDAERAIKEGDGESIHDERMRVEPARHRSVTMFFHRINL
jgi:RNA recognition motif-containing protein